MSNKEDAEEAADADERQEPQPEPSVPADEPESGDDGRDRDDGSAGNGYDPDAGETPNGPRPDGPRSPQQGGAEEQLDEDEDLLDGSDLGSEVHVDSDVEIEEEEEDNLLGGLQINSSADIQVPDRLVDQVIGQDHARDIVLKAAKQRRHVMMIGSPGTGKSMLAKAMSQLLPKEELQDVLVYHNPDDGNEPKVRTVPAGKGDQIVDAHK